MAASHVCVDTHNYMTTVTINRPEKRNALTYDLFRELKATMERLGSDPQTRVVVIRGAGTRAFSAGMDLGDVLQGIQEHPEAPIDHELVHGTMQAVEAHPNPVIAMINGDAFAGGCELALHCDFRFMADHARIGMPLAKRGLLIPFPLVQKLVHMVGPVATSEILLRGAPLRAQRAHELNLVHRVLPSEHLEPETMALATELAANAPVSVRGFKQMIATAAQAHTERHEQAMHELMVQGMNSADAKEGLQAFLEKRAPQYTGR
ncbi:MAG: hypothetical protein ETSY1_26675 [Candidatus Entotheonella factor]|uniref:Enoyl-CoA hydratase n=1 Tax=Entotheonella factor TaxID=1429438 RepID=W4LEL2_ENTF1|nr:MAG: hypothetical protein ETSY1_26675 [Candidatus Entotheonella factor]